MIVGALVARNEADRYLKRSIQNAQQFCDKVIVVDDGSTDDTFKVCKDLGCRVHKFVSKEGFWGNNETQVRALLWKLAASEAGSDGWIYFFDADHELVGLSPAEFRLLCKSDWVTTWNLRLYDMWSETEFRVDGHWQAHAHPRAWLVRAVPAPDWQPQWEVRDIHSGHLPGNYPVVPGVVPGLARIAHLGYIQEAHRTAKAEKYLALDSLSQFERAHAASILDPAMTIPIPEQRTVRILVGAVIRKPPQVIEQFVRTLTWQRLRTKCAVSYHFILNFADEPYADEVRKLLQQLPNVTVEDSPAPSGDYGEGNQSRQWSKPAFARMATLKNRILQRTVNDRFDFAYLVDADVMTDPTTLQSLLDSAGIEEWFNNPATMPPIVSGVYWTRWQKLSDDDTGIVHAGPQVWLVHPYQLHGRGKTEPQFRGELMDRKRVRVWGLGACTLIPVEAIRKGVNFSNVDGLPPGPMSEGEDRHFCARANILHVRMIADAWPDIYHAYHPEEYDRLNEQVDRLDVEHRKPEIGSLVSAKLELLEPVTDQYGHMFIIGARYVRGRLGALPVFPQIEQTLTELDLGDSKLLRVQYPVNHPVPQLRLQTRLFRVTLLDAKPFRIAPTVEEEVFVSPKTGRYIDHTTLTGSQLDELAGDVRVL